MGTMANQGNTKQVTADNVESLPLPLKALARLLARQAVHEALSTAVSAASTPISSAPDIPEED